MNLALRAFSADDQEFIFKVYASTRLAEIAPFGWDAEQQEAFLRMQFNAQQRWYDMAYTKADHNIILSDGKPAGRIMVLRDPGGNTLIDIALLSEYRGHGIGGKLLADLIAESDGAGVPVKLQVVKTKPAIHLYERLGFVRVGESDIYYQMERNPTTEPSPLIDSDKGTDRH